MILLTVAIVGIYNGLVKGRNRVKNSFAQIDVQLKRRYDLIPNLVETSKGYMKHERETFETITKARSAAMGARTVAEAAQAEGQLADALSKFMLVVENYPELKANQNVLELQEQLTTTENQISFSRQHYNATVLDYNTNMATFPSVLIAGPFGFSKREFFDAEPEAAQVPQVDLGSYNTPPKVG